MLEANKTTKPLPKGFEPEIWCAKYGTPLYVYDAGEMEKQITAFRQAFSVDDLHIHYACKALTNINILRLMRRWGVGLDTVSLEEVNVGLLAGFSPEEIMFTPNMVGFEEIAQAVELGVRINIDNLPFLLRFGQVFPETPVCVRLNPHILAGGNMNISVGHTHSKFGISFEQIDEIKTIVKNTGLKIEGLHIHVGSDVKDAESFVEVANLLFEVALDFPDLSFLDLGGGFKIKYRPEDKKVDLTELGQRLSAAFQGFCNRYGKKLSLIFEPGKYLVSEAGYFFVQVNVVKRTPYVLFAGVDSGFNHLIRPMFYDAYHHITNCSNPDGVLSTYDIVGNICETDTFAKNRELPEIKEGDILCFHQAGAYGYTMASNYNSRPRPAEALFIEGGIHIIRKRETLTEILQTQVELSFLK
jgi:diaminopimelate decarboxylase